MSLEFNINEFVWVKLRPSGERIYRDFFAEFARFGVQPIPLDLDVGGWARFQLWDLMRIFGPHMSMGFDPPFETTIRLASPASRTEETPAVERYRGPCGECVKWDATIGGVCTRTMVRTAPDSSCLGFDRRAPAARETRQRTNIGGTFPGDLDVMPSGHTRHCEKRQKWGDGECECSKGRAVPGSDAGGGSKGGA